MRVASSALRVPFPVASPAACPSGVKARRPATACRTHDASRALIVPFCVTSQVSDVGIVVPVGVAVGVAITVGVSISVAVGVWVDVGVWVGVDVGVGVLVGVLVAVLVGVNVAVEVGVRVGVFVGAATTKVPLVVWHWISPSFSVQR
jgi:hypothetical protein